MNGWVPVLVLIQISVSHPFIIPDEVPSLLSVIYSNIPTIKKGTDSRLGWGFRLGDRADFQVLVELGPQTYTQPLANQPDKSDTSKRDSAASLVDVLWAQRQHEKKKKLQMKLSSASSSTADATPHTDGANWLQDWAKSMRNSQKIGPVELKPVPGLDPIPGLEPRPGLGVGEIDAKSVIPDDSTLELAELLKTKKNSKLRATTTSTTTTSSKKANEGALDDVDLS